jgi:hypothetical protein
VTIANVNIKKVLFRRGNTIQNDNYRGVFGEVSVDTEVGTLRVHDGAVVGGTRLATYTELTDVAVGNLDLTGYATTSQITAANTEIAKLRANITAANAAIVSNYNFLLSNAGIAHSEINGLRADITAANVAWTANAATQATAINLLNSNLTAFGSYANATFTGGGGGSNYSNTNVAAYLTGSITTGNIIPTTNAVFTLGNTTHWWKELYVGSNTIYIGGVPLSIDANQNLLIDGNIVQGGNVDAVNSNVAVIDANIGAYQRWANINAAVQTTTINTTNANIGAYQIYANANAAAQTIAINTINANVAAANAAIESVTAAWTANAGAQSTEINSLRANVTAANATIATLQTQVYSNVNTAAYLTGAITTGNITAANVTVENNAVVLGNLRVAGTQTTVNATTLSITDLWVTVADGATQASDAHGAGLRVDGALANIAYSSVSDSFDFNKPITANLRNTGNIVFSDGTFMTTSWVANAESQQTQINSIDANIGAYQIYANANIGTATTNISDLQANLGSYQIWANSAIDSVTVANLDNNGHQLTLNSDGSVTILNAISTQPGQYFIAASDTSTEMSWSNSVQAPNTGVYSGIGSGPTGTGISVANTDGTGTWVFKNWDFDMSGNLTVPGDILPAVDNTHDLGSASQRFRHLYVGPGTVYVGNAAIKTTATGNLILPGLTRAIASTAYAEEVYEEDDQEYSFATVPTVIDNARYSDLSGRVNGLSFTPAEYSVDQLDGEGYIDGITITSPGSGYSDQVDDLADQDMWATEVATPFTDFNANDWVQIPFRVNSRAGESEYDFNTGGGSGDTLTNGDWAASLNDTGSLSVDNTDDEQNYFTLTPIGNEDASYGLQIGIDNQVSWFFSNAGGITFPDDTVQTTAYTGGNGGGSGDRLTNGEYSLILDSAGKLSFPGNLVIDNGVISNLNSIDDGDLVVGSQIEVVLERTMITNQVTNSLGEGGPFLQTQSLIEVTAGNVTIGSQVTNGLGDGSGSLLAVASLLQTNASNVIIGYATLNSLEESTLQTLNSVEINSNNVLIGQRVTNLLNGNVTLDAFTGWEFSTDGNLTLPAGGDILNSNGQSVLTSVTVGNVASGAEGALWYNTEDGRTYVYALDTWIDASPAVVPGNMVGYGQDGNITLNEDARINYANGVSIINSVYGDS